MYMSVYYPISEMVVSCDSARSTVDRSVVPYFLFCSQYCCKQVAVVFTTCLQCFVGNSSPETLCVLRGGGGLTLAQNKVSKIVTRHYNFHSHTGGNPVFQPPLNVGELEIEQMELENQQGNPVRDFLSSKDYTELLQPQVSHISSHKYNQLSCDEC